MNNIELFKKISVKYHKSHIPYTACLLIPVLLCVIVIYNIINLQTSFKMHDYLAAVKIAGNYDFLMYDVSKDDMDKLASSDKITRVGVLTRLKDINTFENSDIRTTIGFADENAVEMLPLEITGSYPQKENEILTTREFLVSNGEKASVGTIVSLCIDEKEYEFKVTGIYEKYSVSNRKKYKRFTYSDTGADGVFDGYPEIYVSRIFSDEITAEPYKEFCNAVMIDSLVTSGFDDSNIYDDMLNKTGEFAYLNKYDKHADKKIKSTLLNQFVIGFSSNDKDGANTNGYNNVSARATSGESHQDYLVTILIPFITVVLIMISLISVASMIRIGVIQRKQQFKTLMILGASRYQLLSCITAELVIISVFGTAAGLISGDIIYRIIIIILGEEYIYYTEVNEIVKKVMPSAYPYMLTFALFAVVSGIISACIVLKKDTSGQQKNCNTKKFSRNNIVLMKQLKDRRNKAMRTGQLLELVVMSLISISATISYCYFMTEKMSLSADKNTLSPGIYYAEKDYERLNAEGYLENNHDLGIPSEIYEKLALNKAVEKSFGSVINMSSRLCYDDSSEFNQKLKSLYTRYTMISTTERDDDLPDAPEGYVSRTKLMEKIGYPAEQYTHSTPMTGITDDYLEELKNYVIQGEINIDKIKSGEEVILLQPKLPQDDPMYEFNRKAVPRYYKIELADCFKTGEILPLTDILFSGEGETNDEMYFSNAEEKKALSTAERVDIPVKVGAIVDVRDNPELYDLISLDNIGKYPLFNIICSTETFKALGLPDCNITRMYLRISDESDIDSFNDEWETEISRFQYLKTDSGYDILKAVSREKSTNFKKFAVLFAVLMMTGAFSLLTAVWQQCESEKRRLKELYILGASKRDLFVYTVIRDFLHIISSLLITVFTVWGLQYLYDRFFMKIINDSGGFSSADTDNDTFIFWLDILPVGAEWFKFDVLALPLFLLFLSFSVMVFAVAFRCIRKVNTE